MSEEEAAAAAAAAGDDTPWFDSLPEDSVNESDMGILKRFESVPELAKGYLNAFNLVGRSKIPMPESDADWDDTYNRLGRPEDSNEYELNMADDLPQELKTQMSENQDWFKLTAHEIGLNKKQADALYTRYTSMVGDTIKTRADTVTEEMRVATETLRTEYGQAYEGKLILANRAIDQIGGEALINLFDSSGVGRNPEVVKAFVKIGEMIGEEIGIDKMGEPLSTPEDLQMEIDTLMQKPAYINAQDPSHNSVVKKVQQFMKLLHPEEG